MKDMKNLRKLLLDLWNQYSKKPKVKMASVATAVILVAAATSILPNLASIQEWLNQSSEADSLPTVSIYDQNLVAIIEAIQERAVEVHVIVGGYPEMLADESIEATGEKTLVFSLSIDAGPNGHIGGHESSRIQFSIYGDETFELPSAIRVDDDGFTFAGWYLGWDSDYRRWDMLQTIMILDI